MSSKGKRSSILKKQPFLSLNKDDTATTTTSVVYKSNKKIEFNRKKSIKEFLVGEDTDTIWGNSYEVSTDGTPSGGLGDATVGNNTLGTVAEDQNKENRTENLAQPAEDASRPSPSSTNTSWDLSITIADDEKRRIRTDVSALFSQSLNTTDRLFVEPCVPRAASAKVKLKATSLALPSNVEIHAMDISPMKGTVASSPNKSPRKMIYYHPSEDMFVGINDVPQETNPVTETGSTTDGTTSPRVVFQTPTKSLRNRVSEAPSQGTTLRGNVSLNASETWNSHPQAMMNQFKQLHSNMDDLGNMSSDVDTTLAITNTVAKLLESGPNLSITLPTNMELDETTTTDVRMPTNALARARPSFLPSSQCPVDESQDDPQTPPNRKQAMGTLPSIVLEKTSTLDFGSPVEGKSIISKDNVNKSSTSSRHGLSIDFGFSSLSLKLPPNSPEIAPVARPKILRPTLPFNMLDAASNKTEPMNVETPKDKGKIPTAKAGKEQSKMSRETIHAPEEIGETFSKENHDVVGFGSDCCNKPMDETCFDHKEHGTSAQSRMTVAMEESMKQTKSYRPTVYDTKHIVEESLLPSSNLVQRNRATLMCDEKMEMTREQSQSVPAQAVAKRVSRRSIYEPEPMMDVSIEIKLHSDVSGGQQKPDTLRDTIHEKVSIDETIATSVHLRQLSTSVPSEESLSSEDHHSKVVAMNDSKRLTKHDVREMEEIGLEENQLTIAQWKKSSRMTDFSSAAMEQTVSVAEEVENGEREIRQNTRGKSRPTIHELEVMDETNLANLQSVRMEDTLPMGNDNTANLTQAPNALTNTFDCLSTELGMGHGPRKVRHTKHEMEEMDAFQIENGKQPNHAPIKTRYSTYNREDMDASEIDGHWADCVEHMSQLDSSSHSAKQRCSSYNGEKMNCTEDNEKMQRMRIHSEGHSKPRLTTYEKENMDDANLTPNPTIVSHESQEPPELHERSFGTQSHAAPERSRLSIHQAVAMDETNTENRPALEERLLSETSTTPAPVDVTNYNAFLVHHEMSHGAVKHSECPPKQRLTTYYMDGMQEAGLDSTRLSKERRSLKEPERRARLSIYPAEPMDETRGAGDHQIGAAMEQGHEAPEVIPYPKQHSIHQPPASSNSPMQMSPAVERLSNIPTRVSAQRHSQRTRQSIYQPAEMESTLIEERQVDQLQVFVEEQPLETSASLRKCKLRNIVQHAAVADMDGFSLLADDEDAAPPPKNMNLEREEKAGTHDMDMEGHEEDRASWRGKETDVLESVDIDHTSVPVNSGQKSAPKYRQTICRVSAMMDDTMAGCVLGNDTKSSAMELQVAENRAPCEDSPAPTSLNLQRKSSVCMEETTLPKAVRIERSKSTFEVSPIVCAAEHPPSLEKERCRQRETICDAEEMMETMHAGVHFPPIRQRSSEGTTRVRKNRQTIHKPSTMDLTLGASSGTLSYPDVPNEPVSNRRTIYSMQPMEGTPPYEGKPPAKDNMTGRLVTAEGTTATVETTPPKESKPNPRQLRRPRQTILIPLDMDVEDDESPQQTSTVVVKEEEQSFALAMLPRETTEDRVLRCAPPMSTAVLRNGGGAEGLNHIFRVPSVEVEYGAEMTKMMATGIPGRKTNERGHASSRFIPPSSTVHELSDISMCNSTLRASEFPQIGNISGMMSMREVTEPLPPTPRHEQQDNSVSVICRVERQTQPSEELFGKSTAGMQQSLAFASVPAPDVVEVEGDDVYYDAEDDEEGTAQQGDPLSLTKSRHLTMKFIDVEQLERMEQHRATVVVPSTTSKRVHAQVLCSPVVSRADEIDPLHVTSHQQQLQAARVNGHTPQGPMKKRARTFGSPMNVPVHPTQENKGLELRMDEKTSYDSAVDVTNHCPKVEVVEEEMEDDVLVKVEHPTMTRFGSQTVIHDPSVFAIDEEDLLDNESNPPCTSLMELSDPTASPHDDGTPVLNSKQGVAKVMGPLPIGKLNELSFYRDFANLTIENLDSWNEATNVAGGAPAGTTASCRNSREVVECGSDDCDQGVECISLSDDDSLTITPPRRTLRSTMRAGLSKVFDYNPRSSSAGVLESTIANEIMHDLRQKHPETKHACCAAQSDECLCRTKRELERREEACNLVWAQFCGWLEAINQRLPIPDDEPVLQAADGEARRQATLEEQIEELNWRLLRTKLEHNSFSMEELNNSATKRRSRSPISGQFPETPSVAFLGENLRSCLSDPSLIDTSPPPGATLPAIPRFTFLVSNKLSSDLNTRWQLDCSEESDGILVLRHRTLRSVVVSVQLQQRQGKSSRRQLVEDRRIDRIVVRECQQGYIHSPKLLLAHIEFMRLAKETTERTLRSTYRTMGSLMGLWQRFDELLRRVFGGVNRLSTIIRNNDALLCYDAQMERFFVKKLLYRSHGDGNIETNMLTVHFNWIGSICASGVSFKRPNVEVEKLLPRAGNDRHHHPIGSDAKGDGCTTEQTGLMFLECLLWNMTKYCES